MNDANGKVEEDGVSAELPYYPVAIIRNLWLGKSLIGSVGELEILFADFLDFQRLNKDDLIQTGLPKRFSGRSLILDTGLSNLYFTRLPNWTFVSFGDDGRFDVRHTWWEGCPTETSPVFVFDDSPSVHNYSYWRMPDLDCWPYHLRWPFPAKITNHCSRAAPVPFLRLGDILRIEGERSLLYEIKESLLVEVCHALKSRDASALRERCIERVRQKKITNEFLDFYLQVEAQYRLMRGRPHIYEDFVVDDAPGGVGMLLWFVCLVELALGEPDWDGFAELWVRVRKSIGASGLNVLTADYSQLSQIVRTNVIDALAGWNHYYEMTALAESQMLFSERLDVEMPTPSLPVSPDSVAKVKATLDKVFGGLRDFALNPEGRDLHVSTTVRGSDKLDHENICRREGVRWEVTYKGNTVQLKNETGARHIMRLIESKQKTPALLLVRQENSKPGEILAGPGSLEWAHWNVEVTDSTAIASYQTRLKEIKEERAEAESKGDEVTCCLLDQECEGIDAEITSVKGRRGKPRKATNEMNQASKAVREVIYRVYRQIKTDHPLLYSHLKSNLHLGVNCHYAPLEETAWRVEWGPET